MSDSDACEWYIWAMAITIIVFQNLRIEKCQLSDVRMVHQPIGNTTVGGTVMSHDHKTKTMWQHTRRWSSWPTSRQSKIGMIIYDSQSMYWSMSLAPLGLVNLVKAKSHSLVPQIRNRVFLLVWIACLLVQDGYAKLRYYCPALTNRLDNLWYSTTTLLLVFFMCGVHCT